MYLVFCVYNTFFPKCCCRSVRCLAVAISAWIHLMIIFPEALLPQPLSSRTSQDRAPLLA